MPMFHDMEVTVEFVRAVCDKEAPLRCYLCGSAIAAGSTYIRRVLPATGSERIFCTDCEPFRLVDLPVLPDRVQPEPFLP